MNRVLEEIGSVIGLICVVLIIWFLYVAFTHHGGDIGIRGVLSIMWNGDLFAK